MHIIIIVTGVGTSCGKTSSAPADLLRLSPCAATSSAEAALGTSIADSSQRTHAVQLESIFNQWYRPYSSARALTPRAPSFSLLRDFNPAAAPIPPVHPCI